MQIKVLEPYHRLIRTKTNKVLISELKTIGLQDKINQLLEFVQKGGNKTAGYKTDKPRVVGLSANQVGINKSICVVDLGIGHKNYSDLHVLINPRIVAKSKQTNEYAEGCVNLANIRGFVKRSKQITVKAIDRSGNKITLELKNWPAVLLQHETDHLNGKLFIDYLPDPKKPHLVKDNEFKKHKKLGKKWNKFINVSNLISK